ncbi:asparagine synthase (glutamine-hydrolyzing) [Propionivibrio sp.]|uniref:asparagine synthase (glutamine-hydrolyzing) n=1 Tax=Propionivibrio sp. TaxID=2212460 RepID=UPI003BF1BC3F
MCGILGYLRRPSASARRAFHLETAVSSLSHRGPDDHGILEEEAVGLGFVRLSIIDLSPAGHQPMFSPDGRYVIVFNGEIYNFPDLRTELEAAGESFVGHSDTEILLRLFMRRGFEACLAALRGMFAFAIWDRHEKQLWLARDRLGVKPLVYGETPDGFVFASEIGSLFNLAPDLPRTPDYAAIDQYLTYQYVPAPLTGFSALRKLPPAHAMIVRDGKIERIFRYWDIDHSRRSELSFNDACDSLREKILEATRIRMVADVPLGAFLSGGVDSSITVAAMARLSSQPVKTYAIGFEDRKFNELPYARQVAEYLGTEHHEEICRPDAVELLPELIGHLGEPFADNSILPTYYVSRFARRDVTVALTGDGADEAFAGYRRHYHIRRVEALQRMGLVPIWRGLRRATVAFEGLVRPDRRHVFPHTQADQMLSMKGAERFRHLVAHYPEEDKARLVRAAFREHAGNTTLSPLREAWERGQGASDALNRWLYVDATTYLPNDILAKVDIASMAVSLECRSPFLDHQVLEFAASLPSTYKLNVRGRSKHILKEAFKDWLPPGFLDRPKMGFSAPMPTWLSGDLAPMMRETLLGNPVLGEWFDRAAIERFLDQHASGERSNSKRLWPLLCLSIWADRFKVST